MIPLLRGNPRLPDQLAPLAGGGSALAYVKGEIDKYGKLIRQINLSLQ